MRRMGGFAVPSPRGSLAVSALQTLRAVGLACTLGLTAGLLAAPASAAGQGPFVVVLDTDETGGSGDGLAWWLRLSIVRPMGRDVAGVPLADINRFQPDAAGNDWCWAQELSRTSYFGLSRETQLEIDATLAAQEPDFRVVGPLIGSGSQEAAVGFYEDCYGDQGAFLLIIDQTTREVLHLETWTEWPTSVIWLKYGDEGALEFGSCFECGHAEALFYDDRRRRFYRANLGD